MTDLTWDAHLETGGVGEGDLDEVADKLPRAHSTLGGACGTRWSGGGER